MTDIAKLKSEVKMEIRALLISKPNRMIQDRVSLRDVLSEYKSICGRELPFLKLGYNCAEALFRDIPDVVKITYTNGSMFLSVLSDETTRNIEQLVKKNKISPSIRKICNYRNQTQKVQKRVLPGSQIFPNGLRKKIAETLEHYPHGIQLDVFNMAHCKLHGSVINYDHLGFSSLEECLGAITDVVQFDRSDPIWLKVRQVNSGNTTYKAPMAFASINTDSASNNTYFATNNTDFATNNTDFASNNTTSELKTPEMEEHEMMAKEPMINSNVRKKLIQVLQHSPYGIWLTDLQEEYEVLHSTELDIRAMGFHNAFNMVAAFPSIFTATFYDRGPVLLRYTFDKNDWESRSPSIDSDILSQVLQLLLVFPEGLAEREFEYSYLLNCKKKLAWHQLGYKTFREFLVDLQNYGEIKLKFKGNDLVVFSEESLNQKSPEVPVPYDLTTRSPTPEPTINPLCGIGTVEAEIEEMPSDAALPGEQFILQDINPDITYEQPYFSVFIGHIDSPGQLWFQIIGPKTSIALETLMLQLHFFYNGPRESRYKVPEDFYLLSMICVALFPEDQAWHRGIITSLSSNEDVLIMFVDYGTECLVPRKNIRLLRKRYCELPAQAIRARLSGIQPPSDGVWPKRAQKRLLELCSDRSLSVRMTSCYYMDRVSIELCDMSGEKSIFLNDVMIKERYALRHDDPNDYDELVYAEMDAEENNIEAEENNMEAEENNMEAQENSIEAMNNEKNRIYSNAATIIRQPITSPQSVQSVKAKSSQYGALNPVVVEMLLAKKKKDDMQLRKNAASATGTQSKSPAENLITHQKRSDFQSRPIQDSEDVCVTLPKSAACFSPFESNGNSNHRAISRDIYHSDEYEQLMNEARELQTRYCKRVKLGTYQCHLINFEGRLYLTDSELSDLIYGINIIEKMFKLERFSIETKTVTRSHCPLLFYDLKKFDVSGFTRIDQPSVPEVQLYPLESCLLALAFVKHPSVTLKRDIENHVQFFNPKDPFWTEIREEEYNAVLQDTIPQIEAQIEVLRKKRIGILNKMLVNDTLLLLQELNGVVKDIILLSETISMAKKNSPQKSSSDIQNPAFQVMPMVVRPPPGIHIPPPFLHGNLCPPRSMYNLPPWNLYSAQQNCYQPPKF